MDLRILKSTYFLVAVMAVIGVVMILYATVIGPWAVSDGAVYIKSAENLLNGRGLGLIRPSGEFQPLNHFPPLFPLSLSLLGLFGLDLVAAARFMNALLFGMLIMLFGSSLFYFTRSMLIALLTCGVMLTLPVLVNVSTGAISEPLFLLTGFGSILSMFAFMRLHERKWLLLSAILGAMTFLTRYIGLAFIVSNFLALIAYQILRRERSLSTIISFTAAALSPMIFYLILVGDLGGNRQYAFNAPAFAAYFKPTIHKILALIWFDLPGISLLPAVPDRTKLIILLTGLLPAALIFLHRAVSFSRQERRDPSPSDLILISSLMILFTLSYFTIWILTYIFTDPKPGIIPRMLVPIQLSVLFSLITAWFFCAGTWRFSNRGNWILGLLLVGIMLGNSNKTFNYISSIHDHGRGFTSPRWRQSGTIKALEGLDEDVVLISTKEEVIYFLTDRPAYDFPEIREGEELPLDTPLLESLGPDLKGTLEEKDAAVVMFNTSYWDFDSLYGDSADERIKALLEGLEKYHESFDGEIYIHHALEH